MAFGDKLANTAEMPSAGMVERDVPLAERVMQLQQRMNVKDSEIVELQKALTSLANFVGYKF